MPKLIQRLLLLFFSFTFCVEIVAQLPEPTQEFRGIWVTQFKDNILGNVPAEDELIAYAIDNEFNYLICTNMFQILTASCGSFTVDMVNLQSFIAKAHDAGIAYISGNVGSLTTAEKIQLYNNCGSVIANEKLDMITYECEFYNAATNGSCPNYASYISQLTDIKTICSTTNSSSGAPLICEAYIGGEGTTGLVHTYSSEPEMEEIAGTADHILLTYYRTLPSSSSGNFFNWTIERLNWIAKSGTPSNIVLLLKSRNTDGNNMNAFLHGFPGTHYDAVRAPYFSWVEGMAFDPTLAKGYRENYDDGTYPWLSGIQVQGFAWFENEANLEAAVLPINWKTFIVTLNSSKDVEILWSTLGEKDNDFFELEKSRDGKNWISFQKIKGKGNSNSQQNYSTIDEKAFPLTSYYRIKQVDYDGKVNYSKIQTVSIPNYSTFLVFPNPGSDIIYLNVAGGIKQEVFEIKNLLGQSMGIYRPSDFAVDEISVDVSTYPAGLYLITTENQKQLFQKF